MGIPVYFKTIVSEYQDSILIKHRIDKVDSLFFDLNCLIHPCCRNETDESIMIQNIINDIHKIIDYSNVKKLIYISIDGVAPGGKLKQQKMRRYKSVLEKKIWDTNAISPGTNFMKKLNLHLKEFKNLKQYDNLNIIINDSDIRGEGEHKILQYIKKNNLNNNTIIYGLDADLIQLSLVSKQKDIFLLRERTEYNIEDTDNEFIYLQIDELKKFIIKDFNISFDILDDILINDYIFICFFMGNDFINHLSSINLRYNGYSLLIETYQKLQNDYQGYFQLINLNLDHNINLCFLKEFLFELSKKEKDIFHKIMNIREKQYNRCYNQYHESFNDFKKYISSEMQSDKKNHQMENQNISLEAIYSYQNDNINNQIIIKDMLNNLPILFFKQEKDIFQKNKYYDNFNKNDLCKDYLNSLLWTSHYYFKECINWKWKTEFNKTPLLKDLSFYCSNLKELSFDYDNKEFTQKEQLEYILPIQSYKIQSLKIKNKKKEIMNLELLCNRYLWECHIDFHLS